eukprot:1577856-Rhodomonas_salina.1
MARSVQLRRADRNAQVPSPHTAPVGQDRHRTSPSVIDAASDHPLSSRDSSRRAVPALRQGRRTYQAAVRIFGAQGAHGASDLIFVASSCARMAQITDVLFARMAIITQLTLLFWKSEIINPVTQRARDQNKDTFRRLPDRARQTGSGNPALALHSGRTRLTGQSWVDGVLIESALFTLLGVMRRVDELEATATRTRFQHNRMAVRNPVPLPEGRAGVLAGGILPSECAGTVGTSSSCRADLAKQR